MRCLCNHFLNKNLVSFNFLINYIIVNTQINEQILCDYEINEKEFRSELLEKSYIRSLTFNVEFINQHGAYWGTLSILKTFEEQFDR